MAEQNIKNGNLPLVAVHMLTFNHAAFIKEAIEGVLNQKTNFPIRLFISDDASTDSTEAVCLKYQNQNPRIIDYSRNEINIGSTANGNKNLVRCFNSGAKYLAILDADDYWCDDLKLQKQVAVLEKEGDQYSICFTDVNYVDKDNNIRHQNFIRKYYKDKGFADQGDLLTYMPLPTQTTVFNIDDMQRKLPEDYDKVYNADAYLYSVLTKKKNAVYLDQVTAVYRTHSGGIMSGIGEMGRLKKTVQSLYYLLRKGVLNTSSRKKVEMRIVHLQIDILNLLIYNGSVSVYFREFFNYLYYSFAFCLFQNFGLNLSRFFRLLWRVLKDKIGFQ